MKRLRQVALVLESLVLSGGLALGQAKLGPHVVDSNSQRIGYFSGGSAGHEAVVFIDGAPYLVQIARDGFVTADVTVYVEQADCSGQRYVRVRPDQSLLERAWFTTDGFFHYPVVASTVEVHTDGLLTLHGDGSLTCVQQGADSLAAAPLVSIAAPTFTPPFLVVDTFPVSSPPAQATFNDVPTNHPFFQFIEALYASGITAGCQASPLLYCPDNPVTRGQMAVFLAKALGL